MSSLVICDESKEDQLYRTINLTAILDKELSWKAKGIHTYIRTRPKDWQLWINDLFNKATDGETGLRSGINELIEKKYLFRHPYRDEKKRIQEWVYISFNQPTKITRQQIEKLLLGNLNLGNLNLENQGYSNKIDSNKNFRSSNKDKSLLEEVSPKPSPQNPSSISLKKVSLRKRRVVQGPEHSAFNFWNGLGKPLTGHRPSSTTGQNALQELRKKLKQGNSFENIKARMRIYYDLLSSSDTSITASIPGHLVSLEEFLSGFKSHTKERMRKQGVDLDIKSWFDECALDKDPLSKFINPSQKIPDEYPAVTKSLKNQFVKTVLGGIAPKKWTARDEVAFRRAAIKLMTFFFDNGKKIHLSYEERKWPSKLTRYVFASLSEQLNEDMSKVHPGWLCSEMMFNKTLPAYLHNQAMIIQ